MGICMSCPAAVDAERKNKVIEIRGVSKKSRKLLDRLDDYSLVLIRDVPPLLAAKTLESARETSEYKHDTLGWRKKENARNSNSVEDWEKCKASRDSFEIVRPYKTGSIRAVAKIDILKDPFECEALKLIQKNSNLFPLVDCPVLAHNDNDVVSFLKLAKELKLINGKIIEAPSSILSFDTDAALTHSFFYGLGSVLMEKAQKPDPKLWYGGPAEEEEELLRQEELNDKIIVVDLSCLAKLKLRSGFHSYGVRVHFHTETQAPLAIALVDDMVHLLRPNDASWLHAKYVVRQAVGTLLTTREHLLWTHLIMSNTVARTSTDHLPPPHPLRRLLSVSTVRSDLHNQGAYQWLVPNLSVVHRATGLDHEAMQQLLADGYQSCNIFEPFSDRKFLPELEAMAKDGRFPYRQQGTEWFGVVKDFVRDWISASWGMEAILEDEYTEAFYKDLVESSEKLAYQVPAGFNETNLVQILAQIIFAATAYDALVGAVEDYATRPTGIGLRAVQDRSVTTTDLQSYLLGLIMAASSTKIKAPYLHEDFQELFGQQQEDSVQNLAEAEVWLRFQTALRA